MDLSLDDILRYCSYVAIIEGRLQLEVTTDAPVDISNWLNNNGEEVLDILVSELQIKAYCYTGYSTGLYGKERRPGISLQFINKLTNEEAFVIFNVDLKRKRNTPSGQKGAPVRNGRFSVTKKYKFFKFWRLTRLPLPRRLSAFNESMGKLKQFLFIGSIEDGEKLNKDSLSLLNMSYSKIIEKYNSIYVNNSSTTSQQNVNNSSTRTFNNDSAQSQMNKGLPPNQSTGDNKYGNTVTRDKVTPPPPNSGKSLSDKYGSEVPSTQTVKQWFARYDRRDKQLRESNGDCWPPIIKAGDFWEEDDII